MTPGAPPGPSPRRLAAEAAAALGVGLAVAVATTWPLATRMGDGARDGVDPRFVAWSIDWVQHAISHGRDVFDANLFAPERGTLAYSDPLLGLAVPLLPLRWAGASPMAVANVALLVGFAASAAAGYLFGRVVGRSVGVGVLTGVASGFGPFPTFESNHAQVVAHPGIPLAALGAWWLADRTARRVPSRALVAPGGLVAGALAWQVTVSFYTGAYAGVAALCVLGVRARALGRRGALAAAGALAVGLAVALVVALPYLARADALADFERTLADLRGQGADLVGTDPRLVVWGDALGDGGGWPTFGAPAFPGLVLVALAPWGWWTARRGDRRAVATLGLVLVGVGVALALGTSDEGWRRFAPYRLVFEVVPGFGSLRATARAMLVALPGLGLLAGLGADDLGRRWAARRPGAPVWAVAAGAAVVLCVEGFAPWTDLALTRTRAVDEALGALDEPGGVVYLPVPPPTPPGELSILDFAQADVAYRTTAHHRPTPTGFSGYQPPSYTAFKEAMATFPDAPSEALLAAAGVRFVVVDPEVAGTRWEPLLAGAPAGWQRLGEWGGSVLYRLPGDGP